MQTSGKRGRGVEGLPQAVQQQSAFSCSRCSQRLCLHPCVTYTSNLAVGQRLDQHRQLGLTHPRLSTLVFQNVVLSGGSTMFRDFGRRLQRDLKRVVDARLKLSEELSGGRIKVGGRVQCAGRPPPAWQCGGEASLSGGQLRFDAWIRGRASLRPRRPPSAR